MRIPSTTMRTSHLTFVLVSIVCVARAQSPLNMSRDLIQRGIASANMLPNQPALDAGPLFVQAVAYAKTNGITRVIADPGAYYFLSALESNAHVGLRNINNMTIDFQGSDLIFSQPLFYGMVVYNSTSAVLQNFTVDYQPLPFTQVRVGAVDVANSQIQYSVQAGWPDPSIFNSIQGPAGYPPPQVQVHVFRNGQPAFGVSRMLTQLPINGGHFPLRAFTGAATQASVRPGDIAVLALSGTGQALNCNHCSNSTFRNISIYSSPNAAILMDDPESNLMERVYSIPKPGTDRLVSTFGLGIFMAGPNNQVRLSRAIRTMDDGFEFSGRFVGTVQSQPASKSLTVVGTGNGPTMLGEGVNVLNNTPVAFQRLSDGAILSSAVIISQSAPSSQPPQVIFNFDRDLPSSLVGTYMYATDPNQNAGNSVLERSTVQNQTLCCRGANMSGLPNSTIRGNYFRHTAFAGFHLEQSTVAGEAFTSPFVNLSVANNVIDGTNRTADWWWFQLGAIQTVTLANPTNFQLMPNSVFSNINVTNNFIADSGRSAVWMGNTSSGSISGNYFLDPNARPDAANIPPLYSAGADVPLVIDTTSSGLGTSNNTVDTTSGRVFVTDMQYRELAAYGPASTIRLNAYNIGTLTSPAITFTDADGVATPVVIQNTAAHALDVQIPPAAGLGGAYLTVTSGNLKYFGTLFVDSQDNIPSVNGCTYELSLSSGSTAAAASNLPILVVTQAGCLYQASDTDSFVSPGAGSSGTAVISIGFSRNTGAARSTTVEIAGQPVTFTQASGLPVNQVMSLSHTKLQFGYSGQQITGTQTVALSFNPPGATSWTASSNQSNITVSPASGTGNAALQITGTSGASGVITVTAAGATNSPQQIQVNVVNVAPTGPFGSFDTPVNNTTGIAGAIPVTGWALDNVEVASVGIWREPIGRETPASNGLVYIGDATFVSGARPDIESTYPNAPLNYRAGWGYMLLTNFLANSSGLPGTGNGIYKLHAIATDKAGMNLDLGTRTITVDNAHASKPFGTIDTPAQGATVAGNAFVNFGWALTQSPYVIPTNGSLLTVYVDGVPLGHPAYNQYRSDIATLFPGLANSNGGVGFFYIDTTTLANGVHTIAWSVSDNGGRTDGIGSRYFTVQNTGTGPVAAPQEPIQAPSSEIVLGRGFDPRREAESLSRDAGGRHVIHMEEVERIELQAGATTGYSLVNGERRPLPIGSTLKGGVFYWQAGPGFLGEHQLVFERPAAAPASVRILIHPKNHGGREVSR